MAMRPTRLAGIAEYYSDDFAAAATLFTRLRQRAIERGEDSHLPMVDADLAMVERARGRLARALEIADEGCEIARMLDSATAQADMLCERSYARATLGDVEGARADIAQGLDCVTDDEYATSWIDSARAFLELSLGDAAANTPPPFRPAPKPRVRPMSSPRSSCRTRSRRLSRLANSTAHRH